MLCCEAWNTGIQSNKGQLNSCHPDGILPSSVLLYAVQCWVGAVVMGNFQSNEIWSVASVPVENWGLIAQYRQSSVHCNNSKTL